MREWVDLVSSEVRYLEPSQGNYLCPSLGLWCAATEDCGAAFEHTRLSSGISLLERLVVANGPDVGDRD